LNYGTIKQTGSKYKKYCLSQKNQEAKMPRTKENPSPKFQKPSEIQSALEI